MKNVLKTAFGEFGVKEVAGPGHEPRILEYATDIGLNWVNDDETPWCSIFVNWVCKQCDLPMTRASNARSWVEIGETVTDPHPGDVMMFWRENPHSWKGHVGFFLGYSADLSKVYWLGGNQGNSVSVEAYASDKVLRFQRISSEPQNGIPKPGLKLGSSGPEVFKLQKFLNTYGYSCGDPDGIFGQKTFNALKVLQADHGLDVDGVYGKGSERAFMSIGMG